MTVDTAAATQTSEARRSLADWVGLAARLGLGGTFLAAGLLKVGDPQASVRAVHAYELLPYGVSQALGFALPWLEIGLGVLLLLGLLTRVAASGLAVLLVAFIVAIGSAWARGLSIDCGCFGGGGEVAQGQAAYLPELLRDAGLLLLGLWLVWRPRTPFAVDGGPNPAGGEAAAMSDRLLAGEE